MKPEYLYHGSQYQFEIVKSHQAYGESPNESLLAIYAYQTFEEVISFALPIRAYPDAPEGKRAFRCESGRTYLQYGSINPKGKGYIYKLNSETFVEIEDGQWVSKEEVKPTKVYEISVADYLDTITFSEDAKRIQSHLYE